jgi:NAD(P)-dependent dehydrogenase (short-subunit alcohol dehydrogenase family)
LGRAETLSAEKWSQAQEVNLRAVFRMAQRAAQAMLTRGTGGRIINMGTAAAHRASPFFKMASYIAAKGGVVALTRQLAMEWAPAGITVNCISPGYFPTEINIDPRYGDMHPEYKARILERTPMGPSASRQRSSAPCYTWPRRRPRS